MSILERKNDFTARYGSTNINLKKGYNHHTEDELYDLYDKLGDLVKTLNVKDVTLVFESTVNEAKVKVGDILTMASSGKKGKVTRIVGDMANVDFGGGDNYGIMLRRIKNGVISESLTEKRGETGLYVYPTTSADFKKLERWLGDSDYYAEVDSKRGYAFFPEEKENYDSLEAELDKEFNAAKISVRFEGE
jgi:hypothetical protein